MIDDEKCGDNLGSIKSIRPNITTFWKTYADMREERVHEYRCLLNFIGKSQGGEYGAGDDDQR